MESLSSESPLSLESEPSLSFELPLSSNLLPSPSPPSDSVSSPSVVQPGLWVVDVDSHSSKECENASVPSEGGNELVGVSESSAVSVVPVHKSPVVVSLISKNLMVSVPEVAQVSEEDLQPLTSVSLLSQSPSSEPSLSSEACSSQSGSSESGPSGLPLSLESEPSESSKPLLPEPSLPLEPLQTQPSLSSQSLLSKPSLVSQPSSVQPREDTPLVLVLRLRFALHLVLSFRFILVLRFSLRLLL